jgi:hypothetical protein
MSKERRYTTIDRALRSKRVPLANDEFIKRILQAVGATRVYETTGYIGVERTGGPDLHIYRGGTKGFISEAEVVDIAGDEPRREPSDRTGLWRVVHPEDPGGRQSGPMSGRTAPRDYGLCPQCFTRLAANGACTNPLCSVAS